MKEAKPFFYRINAADLFSFVRDLSKKERAEWVMNFAMDLVAGNSKDEFTVKVIEEAVLFKKNKSDAGIKGMESRHKKQ